MKKLVTLKVEETEIAEWDVKAKALGASRARFLSMAAAAFSTTRKAKPAKCPTGSDGSLSTTPEAIHAQVHEQHPKLMAKLVDQDEDEAV